MRTPAVLLTALVAALLPLHAQNKPIYKVEITIHDSRSRASLAARWAANCSARLPSSALAAAMRSSFACGAMLQTEFGYLDIGVNIECAVHESNGKAAMHGSIDLTGIAPNEGGPAAPGNNPTIKQTRLDLETILDFGRPTTVASMDDPVTARKLQVEATITGAN